MLLFIFGQGLICVPIRQAIVNVEVHWNDPLVHQALYMGADPSKFWKPLMEFPDAIKQASLLS